jgi:hypothetical protein
VRCEDEDILVLQVADLGGLAGKLRWLRFGHEQRRGRTGKQEQPLELGTVIGNASWTCSMAASEHAAKRKPIVVTPGEMISTEQGFMRGHGTIMVEDRLASSIAGVVDRVNKVVSVKTLRSRCALLDCNSEFELKITQS